MTCIILAAGYATRLYPLTENFPKALLEVQGKPILDHLIDDMRENCDIDRYVVVSNHKFVDCFNEWAAKKPYKIDIADDMTTDNDNRLGAVSDTVFAMDALSLSGDLLIIAGDNLLDFSLGRLTDYAKLKGTSCVMRYYEKSTERLKKCGVISIDGERITDMVEKPSDPPSHWCVPPFYYYKASDAALIKQAIKDGCGTDAPGSLLAWMCKHSEVNSMEMPGSRYDIGTVESYREVQNNYRGVLYV